MALPPGLTPKTVTLGIASFADGSLASGRATISMPVNVVHTPSNRPIFSSDITAQFVDGAVSFNLLPTDAPGLNRVDWAYKLRVEVTGASVQPEVIYFTLPTAGPDVVDLDGLVTVPSSAGVPISVDVLTAQDITSPTSDVNVALRAAYAPVALARPAAGRWVALGDSITAADMYLRFAVALAGGRLRAVHNAGVGGNQIDQMLARFDTDVTPYAPTMVSLMGGTNDYTFGCSNTDFRARVQSFVAKVRSIGAIPLLFTSPPCNVLADPDRAKIPTNNAWMADYASREGITLIDAYSVLANPAQSFGMYQAALVNSDGIHPNDAGHYAVAQLLATAVNALLPARQPFAVTTGDPTNLLTNGLMKDTNADGVADNWGQNWGPDAGSSAFSIVSDAAVPGGTMERHALTNATGKVQQYQDVSTGFAAGDVLRFSGLITVSAGMSGAVTLSSNGNALDSRTFSRPFTRGLIDYTFTVPTPAPAALRVELATTALAAGTTGTVDYGALTLRNLTALGIS